MFCSWPSHSENLFLENGLLYVACGLFKNGHIFYPLWSNIYFIHEKQMTRVLVFLNKIGLYHLFLNEMETSGEGMLQMQSCTQLRSNFKNILTTRERHKVCCLWILETKNSQILGRCYHYETVLIFYQNVKSEKKIAKQPSHKLLNIW